ncbi:MAG: hypothetical protein GY714_09215 [Desulfobacterales bacterium]|nr:hypothetical protein [Desulfobacterales bacterium]
MKLLSIFNELKIKFNYLKRNRVKNKLNEIKPYGYAFLNDPVCAELGSIYLDEILSSRKVQLDLSWSEKSLSEVKKELT